MKYMMDYGTNPSEPHKRLCIPYLRKDQPIKRSNFSNILLSLILTFKTYIYHNKNRLTIDDMKQIYDNIPLFNMMYSIGYNASDYKDVGIIRFNEQMIGDDINRFVDILYENMISDGDATSRSKIAMDAYNRITNEYAHQYIIFHFIKSINENDIRIAKTQLNMSYQDIIYNRYQQKQFAYTGTASLRLNVYPPAEKFVFRNIVSDPEEDVEVKLAICQYGLPVNILNTGRIECIKKTKDIKLIIRSVITVLQQKGQPRGLIDLAGRFVRYDNKSIAESITELLNHQKPENKKHQTIYLDGDKPVILNDKSIPYKNPTDLSFYYYDQGHTVGTDIKQPQEGHFGIIITAETRMTDFAQAIFRFRKLNRGTFMSIFMYDTSIFKSYRELYDMLIMNENRFNDSQSFGLKYQLMRAMVRSKSSDYQETDLVPEFMCGRLTDQQVLQRLSTNTIGLDNEILRNEWIRNLHQEIVDAKNRQQFKSIMFGSGLDVQTNLQHDSDVRGDVDANALAEAQKKIQTDVHTEVYNATTYQNREFVTIFRHGQKSIYMIEHADCMGCIVDVATPMFNDQYRNIWLINSKPIYMSYNFLSFYSSKLSDFMSALTILFYKQNVEAVTSSQIYNGDRWCFVVLPSAVMIETELFALYYYADIYPVYDWRGYNMNPNRKGDDNLTFDPLFKLMIGIGIALNRRRQSVGTMVDNLTMSAKILLKFNFLVSTCNRYNASTELKEAFNLLTIPNIMQIIMSKIKQPTYSSQATSNRLDYFKRIFISDIIKPSPISYRHTVQPLSQNIQIKYDSLWTQYNTRAVRQNKSLVFPDGIDRLHNSYIDRLRRTTQSGGGVSYTIKYNII